MGPQGHADLAEFFVDVHKPNYEINARVPRRLTQLQPDRRLYRELRYPRSDGVRQSSRLAAGNQELQPFYRRRPFSRQTGAVHQADTQVFLNATFKNSFSLDGAGSAIGQLRSYGIPAGPGCSGAIVATSTFSGYPCYLDGATLPYNLYSIPIGYRDGTPTPYDVNYSWGPFGDNYVHLFDLSTSRPIGRMLTLGLAYDGTYERALGNGTLNSQWLRSITLGLNLSSESTLTFALRDINGYGGFATQIGNNLAVAFHERFRTGNETLRQLRQSRRGRNPQPAHRQVCLPRRRRCRHVTMGP